MENQPNQILKQDDFDLVCALLYLHWVLLISYTCDPVCGPLSTQVLGWLMIKFVDDPDNTGTNLGPGEWKFKSVENCNRSKIPYFEKRKGTDKKLFLGLCLKLCVGGGSKVLKFRWSFGFTCLYCTLGHFQRYSFPWKSWTRTVGGWGPLFWSKF